MDIPSSQRPCCCQPLIQEQCLVPGSSAFSIFQVIPLQSGLQVTVRLQGGLGLDISADMDVSIWEQELKTSISARSAWLWEWECPGGKGGFPQLPALLPVGPAFPGAYTPIFHGQTSN